MAPKLKPTVGLEIHARLNTGRKLFCGCEYHFGASPNTQVCPVCLGLPGSLPVLDTKAVDLALRAGLALGCLRNPVSEFARKNYFYPDLPRNYQITQFERPLLTGGRLAVPGKNGPEVRIRRIHLEEDAGRSLRSDGDQHDPAFTLVDCNRAGTPLMEIVTEPDLESGSQARQWLQRLLQTLEYLAVCDGNLAEGSLRCDANVGLRITGAKVTEGPLTEIKNLNSFRAIGQAVDHEIERLAAQIYSGSQPRPQTRGWDPVTGQTRFLRLKEQTRDYRYFPEPDLPQLQLTREQRNISMDDLPELPAAREARLEADFHLATDDVRALCKTSGLADFFEAVVNELAAQSGGDRVKKSLAPAKLAATWVLGPISREAEVLGFSGITRKVTPLLLAELLQMLQEETITGKVAHSVFNLLARENDSRSAREIVREGELGVIKDHATILGYCQQVIANYPEQVARTKAGQTQIMEFLVGQGLKMSLGRAQPSLLRQILQAEIKRHPR